MDEHNEGGSLTSNLSCSFWTPEKENNTHINTHALNITLSSHEENLLAVHKTNESFSLFVVIVIVVVCVLVFVFRFRFACSLIVVDRSISSDIFCELDWIAQSDHLRDEITI